MHQVIYEQIHKVRPVHSKSESPQSGEVLPDCFRVKKRHFNWKHLTSYILVF